MGNKKTPKEHTVNST